MATKTKFTVEDRVCYKGSDMEAVRKCAITEDGEQHIIQETSDGKEYFTIDNPYHKDTYADKMFHGKIGDAIQAIKDGYADVILSGNQMNVFTQYAYPIVMIDSKLGEEYRQKSIEGFKESKIGYSIFYGGKNSFGGYVVTDDEGNWAFDTQPKIYRSEEDAKEALEKYLGEAEELAKGAIGKDNKFIGGDIEERKLSGIVRSMAWDMIRELPNGKVELTDDLRCLPNIGFDIRQAIY